MFDLWNKLKLWQKILFIIVITVIIILIILFIKSLFIKKEGFKQYEAIDDEIKDPVGSYVDSWIKSVKNMYKAETFAQPRTLRNFNNLTYLDKNAITTGKYKN